MTATYDRDLRGYGPNPPDPKWPNGAKLALSFVLNYEEGGEHCILHGDQHSETRSADVKDPPARWGVRDLQVESSFEYGSRVGFWQIMRLFKERDMPMSIFAVGLALEHTPWSVPVMMEAGHEIVPHGWRWIDYQHVAEEVERDHIKKCIDLQVKMTGEHPLGFFSGRQSPNTRRLLVEEGGFLYDSDAYNDDLPYWVTVSGKPHLVVPYSNEINDSRLALGNGMNLASEFYAYAKDAFDWLYGLGSSTPKMMSVGLHCRTISRPARIGGLARFLDYVRQHKDVWVCRRVDIARHWQERHPYQTAVKG